jgi:hypothetical protein
VRMTSAAVLGSVFPGTHIPIPFLAFALRPQNNHLRRVKSRDDSLWRRLFARDIDTARRWYRLSQLCLYLCLYLHLHLYLCSYSCFPYSSNISFRLSQGAATPHGGLEGTLCGLLPLLQPPRDRPLRTTRDARNPLLLLYPFRLRRFSRSLCAFTPST